jgi:hypothetical protein
MIKFDVLSFNLNKNTLIVEKPILKSIEWLEEGESWIRYRTKLDLLLSDNQDPIVQHEYNALIADPKILNLIDELREWPGKAITRHKDPKLLLHKLSFLADIGLTIDFQPLQDIVEKIIKNKSEEGPFEVVLNIPEHVGGTGEDQLSWILCDAPSILYSLVKFGMEEDINVHKALKFLVLKARNNGWGCTAGSSLGEKFQGPGRKEDTCPYANLLMLKVLAHTKNWKYSAAAHNGTEALLNLWENSYNKHPYLFKMGSDFRKLKAPLIWYDLLHVTDVLSQFTWVRNDHRFLDMINVLTTKANNNMQFTPESVWAAWEDWEFGQKKDPSRWITFLVLRILKRVEESLAA